MALTPAVFAVGPWVESRVFPVVTDVEVLEPVRLGQGVSFYTRFEKRRQCEFIGLVWYDGPHRHAVEFEPEAHLSPPTRPIGAQATGPWRVSGITRIDGTRAVVFHRCHPLWLTVTEFFDGGTIRQRAIASERTDG